MAIASCTSQQAMAAAGRVPKPNIVFILIDDMGWMDSTVYGSRYYDTPNMERLAERGMVFTDAYAANPLCSPTRASIMTGTYPARLGITTPAGHLPPLEQGASRYPERAAPNREMLQPISRRFLPPEEYTLAEALRDAGYATAHLGKWHLGLNPEHWPEQQGFDVSFHGAPDPGPRSYFSPYQFRAGTVTDGPEGEYITDRLTDEALEFIRTARRPFFLNLWHYGVHGPWGHKPDLTKLYENRVDPRGKQNNPIMASMLKSVDESVGRLLDEIDQLQLSDNTILIFFSDNGGNVHSQTPGGGLPPTNNDPLRAGKASIYEGGIRVPMMVCWPGLVEPGSRCSDVVSSVDFYLTILDIVGLKPKPGQRFDGESIVPLLEQTGRLRRRALFNFFPHGGPSRPPGVTVREGDWKLIRWFETSSEYPERFELYNLREDIGESENLASVMPEKVRQMDGLIDQFLADTGALVPIPNPAYDPATEPVGGWERRGENKLSIADGMLVVETPSGRVSMQTRQVPHVTGPLVVRLRARSTIAQQGIVYWATKRTPRYEPARRVDFHPTADGQWHEYEIRFAAEGQLVGIRIDPSVRAGRVEIDRIRLDTEDGTRLKAWEFDE